MSRGGSAMEPGSACLDYCELAVERGLIRGASAVEAFLTESRQMEAMIEKNDIHVPKGDTYSGIGLRVLVEAPGGAGFKQGFASTNLLSSSSIDSALSAALAIAAASPADPNLCLAQPEPTSSAAKVVDGLYDEAIAGMGLGDALKHAAAFLDGALGYDRRITVDSAAFSAQVGRSFIVNSEGLSLGQRKTVAIAEAMAFAVEGDKVSSFDVGIAGSCALEHVNSFEMGRELAKRVIASLDARPTPSFRGKVLLTPYAVSEMVLAPIAYSCNAEMVQSGRSKWKGMLGREVISPLISVADDPAIPEGVGSTMFDREGAIPTRLDLVSAGVLQDYMYNCRTGRADGRKSNGRASGDDTGLPGVAPTNMIIAPGAHSLDQLIRACDKGLIVNRFSGSVDPGSGDFSGIVKGGHYIEGGNVVHPVKEVMVAGNIYELLSQVVGVSDELWVLANERLPHIMLDGCSVTGR